MDLNNLNNEELIALIKQFAVELEKYKKSVDSVTKKLNNTDDILYWYENKYGELKKDYEASYQKLRSYEKIINKQKVDIELRNNLLDEIIDELDNLRSRSKSFGSKLERSIKKSEVVVKNKNKKSREVSRELKKQKGNKIDSPDKVPEPKDGDLDVKEPSLGTKLKNLLDISA